MDSQTQRLEHIAENGYNFDMSKCISDAWELFRKNPGPFVIYAILVLGLTIGLSLIPILGSVAAGIIGPALTAGYYIGARKLDTTGQLEIADFFKSFDFIIQLFLCSLIGGLLTLLGFVLLIIPGIWFGVAIMFIYQLVVFAKLDFWAAIQMSVKIISKNWFSFFGFLIVIFLINLLGIIALLVGLLITMPLSYLSVYMAYKQVIGFEEGTGMKTSDHLVSDQI